MITNIRVIVPVVYGAIVAILAVTHSDFLSIFAIVGGILVGLMFVLLRPNTQGRARVRR